MATLRLPVQVEVEYRGRAKAGEFQDRESGEVVSYGPKLKFEVNSDDEDISALAVSSGQFDKLEPAFDWETLRKGERLRLHGYVVLHDRGSGRDSYFTIAGGRVERLSAPVKSLGQNAA